jgi:hypothetical protein
MTMNVKFIYGKAQASLFRFDWAGRPGVDCPISSSPFGALADFVAFKADS